MIQTHQKDENFSVFVGNLPFDAIADSLFEIFSKYGKLVHWEVKRVRDTNRPLSYGYVSFEKAEEAAQAVNGGPYILTDNALRVNLVEIIFGLKISA